MKYYKSAILCLFFSLFSMSGFAQHLRTSIYNNEDYQNAMQWLNKHGYIYDSLSAYGVPADAAIAIVFPELMRYSALEDKMEVTGLMVLYTRLGTDYANFSVGRFQMKPSFVQQLETDARKYLSEKEIKSISPSLLNGENTEDARKERVESLTSVRDEVSYLALFYKICLKRFKNILFKSPEERIQFLATAYNCGYHHSVKNLYLQMKKKQFPVYNGILIHHVNYAVLALTWWRNVGQL